MFPHKTLPQKHEPTQNDPSKDWKISISLGNTETIVWNRCSYWVPEMVGTNASTKNNELYNSIVQVVSRGGGDCATKVGAVCTRFVNMLDPVRTQTEIV